MRKAARSWAEQLAGWAIPAEILAGAPEPPWGFLPGMFEPAPERDLSPARAAALGWLGDDGGRVLDVGCGAGAASLSLVPPATRLAGVDEQPGMLRRFTEAAAELGVPSEVVRGRWPEVAGEVPVADVVVCHHVVYDVSDLVAFVVALTGHARRGVVLELGARHPNAYLRPLWKRFWKLDRPKGPSASDALAVIRSCGLKPTVETYERPRHSWPAGEVHLARKRLCLPAERDPEIEAALAALRTEPSEVWSISWPGDV